MSSSAHYSANAPALFLFDGGSRAFLNSLIEYHFSGNDASRAPNNDALEQEKRVRLEREKKKEGGAGARQVVPDREAGYLTRGHERRRVHATRSRTSPRSKRQAFMVYNLQRLALNFEDEKTKKEKRKEKIPTSAGKKKQQLIQRPAAVAAAQLQASNLCNTLA